MTVELDLEGIVAKRADSSYRAGRQPTWAKIKNPDYLRRETLRFKLLVMRPEFALEGRRQ